MNAAVLYWTKSGNTQKVAETIRETLEESSVEVLFAPIDESTELDFYGFDLIFFGFPSYQWRPPKPVLDFLDSRFRAYADEGRVKTGAPSVEGKRAVMFCTYSGPHTGIREAVPATLVAGQYFEHLGIPVVAEWHVVGEFHGRPEMSTKGRLGDIRGRPNEADLAEIRESVAGVLKGAARR